MLLKTRGKASIGNKEYKLVRVTRYQHLTDSNTALISEETTDLNLPILTTKKILNNDYIGVSEMKSTDHLSEGDIIVIFPNGVVRTLYRPSSSYNALLVTERCNSNCLMCSQPPMDRDDIDFLYNIHKELIPLIPKDCKEIGITGGEPTILGKKLYTLINMINNYLPETEIHILTNGRSFSYNDLAANISAVNSRRLMLGIPIYSDYYQIHDYVVQSKHAFYQTMMGIYNLHRYNVKIEIRVVLHKIVVERLLELAEFIYKYIPFASHVALMGLETIGYTKANIDSLWIDPYDYKDTLDKACNYLHQRGMNVSIYNTPLCLLKKTSWNFSRQSISDWKNIYLDQCKNCTMKDKCGGFFSSSTFRFSDHIKPFKKEELTQDFE